MGLTAFQQMKKEVPVSKDEASAAMVARAGQRISAVAPLPNAQWEFVLFESKQPNAFCLPGGKVAVYTGIMEVAQNEAGLAAIMGHEIAHAIARHGAERMTQVLLVNMGLSVADVSLKNTQYRDLILAAIGAGATVGVLLPYSRKHETEADHIGTVYMAKAGYDPNEAVALWERFAEAQQANVPAFLSTHPPSLERAEALRTITQKAMGDYRKVAEPYGKGESLY